MQGSNYNAVMSGASRPDSPPSTPTNSTSAPASAARAAPVEVRVVNWPLRDEPWRACAMLLMLAGLAIATGDQLGVPAGALAAVVLAVAAWRLWIPVTWELNSHGVTETVFGRSIRIPWNAIGSWRDYPGGVLLLPEPDPAPALALRGRFVAWRKHRLEVLALLEYYVGRALP